MRTFHVSTFLFLFTLFFLAFFVYAQADFQADSVYQHIYHLSVTIGPRPMGSDEERRALEWVRDKFISYGADTAFIMPFTRSEAKGNYANTQSGTVVGIFRGETDTCIVVGGHMDSHPATSPGANDNASGTATAIELARLWSQRPRHYTMVFASFGGEEQGLYGSNFFVENFANIDKVALMFSVDMTGSDDDIITIMETAKAQAPRWLIRDALKMDRKLGIRRLKYPTHLATVNNLGHGAGSDHIPFLEKSIPAMDFTAGINRSPIHSSQDCIAFIDRKMLADCGRLVDGLLQKYQSEYLPSKSMDKYMLWQPLGLSLFIPYGILRTFIVLSMLAGAFAYWHSRHSNDEVKLSAEKVAALLLVVIIFSQFGEALVQAIKGVRYPWYLHVEAYIWLMAVWALAGIWLALTIGRRWRFRNDGHIYASRGLILLFILSILSSLASARLALYPAVSLLFLSLAILIRSKWGKMICTLVVPLPMIRLLLSEGTPFIARNLCQIGFFIDSPLKAALYSLALVLGLFLFFLPSAFAGMYTIVSVPLLRDMVKIIRRPMVGAVILAGLIFITFWNYRLPAYDDAWRPSIRAEAEYDSRKGEGKLRLVGNEYFKDVAAEYDTFKVVLSGRKHVENLPLQFTANWVKLEGGYQRHSGERDTLVVDWRLISMQPWYSVQLSIRCDTLKIADVSSPLRFHHRDGVLSFNWRCNPSDTLAVRAMFTIHRRARLIRKVVATYQHLPLTLNVTATHANLYYHTKVIYSDTLKVAIANDWE